MSERSQRLRALVTERLTAAAEDIFILVERTIAEYEEELCRCKEENQRKQQLLDSALPQLLLHRTDAQVQTDTSRLQQIEDQPEVSEPTFDYDIKTESAEEQTGEEDDVEPPDGDATHLLKSESEDVQEEPDPSLLSSFQEEPAPSLLSSFQEEPAPSLLSPFQFESCSSVLPPPEVADRGDHVKKHECVFCGRRFREEHNLQRHIVVHTRQKPFMCAVCSRCFSQEETLRLHMALHNEGAAASDRLPRGASAAGPTSASPFCCPVCNKCFTRTFSLQSHMLTHTGEKPFPCPLCSTRFNRKSNLNRHLKVHAQKLHSV